jgi:hypothetical protein
LFKPVAQLREGVKPQSLMTVHSYGLAVSAFCMPPSFHRTRSIVSPGMRLPKTTVRNKQSGLNRLIDLIGLTNLINPIRRFLNLLQSASKSILDLQID